MTAKRHATSIKELIGSDIADVEVQTADMLSYVKLKKIFAS